MVEVIVFVLMKESAKPINLLGLEGLEIVLLERRLEIENHSRLRGFRLLTGGRENSFLNCSGFKGLVSIVE